MFDRMNGVRSVLLLSALGGLASATVACNKVAFENIPQEQIAECQGSSSSCLPVEPPPASTPPPEKIPNTPEFKAVEDDIDINDVPKIDILFVVDNSGSMAKERAELGKRLNAFVSKLDRLDWRICVTTTDADNDRGDLLPFGNGAYSLDKGTSQGNQLFLDRLISVSPGSSNEQGIHSMNRSFENRDSRCFRDDAALAAIVMSDEDEASTGGYDQYRNNNQYRALQPSNLPESVPATVARIWNKEKIFTAHAIVVRSGDKSCFDLQSKDSETFYGTRYEQLARLTDGVIGDICASDYTKQLEAFASRIERSTASLPLQCEPVSEPDVQVVPEPTGLKIKRDGSKVTFDPALPTGTKVKMKYRCKKEKSGPAGAGSGHI